MNPSQIINELQNLLILDHAISVECKVDNFADRTKPSVRYRIYVDTREDLPIACHVEASNIEDAYTKAVGHIIAHRIHPSRELNTIPPIPNPFPTFLSCSSPEQDDEAETSIEPLSDDDIIS